MSKQASSYSVDAKTPTDQWQGAQSRRLSTSIHPQHDTIIFYDQQKEASQHDMGLQMETRTFVRLGGDAESDLPTPGEDPSAIDLVVLEPSVNMSQADGSTFLARAGLDTPTTPFQGATVGLTGSMRVDGDIEAMGTSSSLSLTVPLRPTTNSTSPPAIEPMVAVSAGLDGYVSAGFGMDIQDSANALPNAALDRVALAPLWAGEGVFALEVHPSTGVVGATLLRAGALRDNSTSNVWHGVLTVASTGLSQTGAPAAAQQSAPPSCTPLASNAAVCVYVGASSSLGDDDSVGDVVVTTLRASRSDAAISASISAKWERMEASWLGTDGIRDGATAAVIVGQPSTSGPSAAAGAAHEVQLVVSLKDGGNGAVVALTASIKPDTAEVLSPSRATVLEPLQAGQYLSAISPSAGAFLVVYQRAETKDTRYHLVGMDSGAGNRPVSLTSGPVSSSGRIEHMAMGLLSEGQIVMAYRDFDQGQALLARGISVTMGSSPQASMRPPVLVDSGSSVPSALRLSVGTVPCGKGLLGYASSGRSDSPCAKSNRFAVVYRDGSAAALVRDAVASGDGRLQITLGRPQSLGNSRKSTIAVGVGLAGTPAKADSVLLLHRGSSDPSALARVGLLKEGPLPVGITRFSRHPRSESEGGALMRDGGSAVSVVLSGALRHPYRSLVPSAKYYARSSDGMVVTQADGVSGGALFVGRAISAEYLSILQSAVGGVAGSGSTGLVGDDGSVLASSSGGSSGASSGGSVPAGTIVIHSADVRDSANLPIGWLPCDGRVLSKAGYPTLWSVIGDTYTNRSQGGVLPTEFKVPDMRGRYPAGVTAVGGKVDGRAFDKIGMEMEGRLMLRDAPFHEHQLYVGVVKYAAKNRKWYDAATAWQKEGIILSDPYYLDTFPNRGMPVEAGTFARGIEEGSGGPYYRSSSWADAKSITTNPKRNVGDDEEVDIAPPSLLLAFIIKT